MRQNKVCRNLNRFGGRSAAEGRTTGAWANVRLLRGERPAGLANVRLLRGRTTGNGSARDRLMSNFGDRSAGMGKRSAMVLPSNC